MLEPSAAFPGLEDLVDLGGDTTIDMRPTLLRVLTDLYLQRPTHTPEDERYYTELALRLIEAADARTRAALAERLATYAAAPRLLVLRLARERIEVARPVLRQSPVLTKDDLDAIAAELGGVHAELIAARALEQIPLSRTQQQQRAAEQALELVELFYAAGATERRWILLNLDYAAIAPCEPAPAMQRADIWRLETAALQHQTETVVREFGRALGLSREQVNRILNDVGGEPIVVAARAMNVPADVLQRMLLFLKAEVGHSVDRVYELSELFTQLSVASARRMLAIWRAVDSGANTRMQHESVPWRAAAENARRALSEVPRRPTAAQSQALRTVKR
jgi:hypothetical protein